MTAVAGREPRCTFSGCGRPQDDPVHVRQDERMRRGRHVFRAESLVVTKAGADFLGKLPSFTAEWLVDGKLAQMHVLAIEAEAIAAERLRVKELMEQGSGDGLEDGRYWLPIAVANEILEPKP